MLIERPRPRNGDQPSQPLFLLDVPVPVAVIVVIVLKRVHFISVFDMHRVVDSGWSFEVLLDVGQLHLLLTVDGIALLVPNIRQVDSVSDGWEKVVGTERSLRHAFPVWLAHTRVQDRPGDTPGLASLAFP